MSLIVDRDEEAPWSAVHKPELLTGQANRRSVHNWHHFSHVIRDETVEQMLIAVLEKVTRW